MLIAYSTDPYPILYWFASSEADLAHAEVAFRTLATGTTDFVNFDQYATMGEGVRGMRLMRGPYHVRDTDRYLGSMLYIGEDWIWRCMGTRRLFEHAAELVAAMRPYAPGMTQVLTGWPLDQAQLQIETPGFASPEVVARFRRTPD